MTTTEPRQNPATGAKMDDFEEFKKELGDDLHRLHDPDYQPSELMCAVLGCDPGQGPGPVQSGIIQAIKGLEPPVNVPPGSRARQDFDLLRQRFVQKLTQEETAECLHMSLRSVQRLQREATYMLARFLWEGRRVTEASQDDLARSRIEPSQAEATPGAPPPDWRSQAEQELASLQTSAPDSAADVPETLRDLLELKSALIPSPAIRIEVAYVQPDLVAVIHPSALRQMLIAAVGRLARHMSSGPITIYARLEDASVKITLTGAVAAGRELTGDEFTHEVLVPAGSSVEAYIDGDTVFLNVKVPSVGEINVLAVDDNPDMFHFYRRCTAGTRYRVLQAGSGREAQERIKTCPPSIIVLDVMLPDVDGWKLLMQLHEDPSTRAIPIIVSSVVREEDLAYSLGAALYLSKPIQPRQFVEALDQARRQASKGAPREQVNSEATC